MGHLSPLRRQFEKEIVQIRIRRNFLPLRFRVGSNADGVMKQGMIVFGRAEAREVRKHLRRTVFSSRKYGGGLVLVLTNLLDLALSYSNSVMNFCNFRSLSFHPLGQSGKNVCHSLV